MEQLLVIILITFSHISSSMGFNRNVQNGSTVLTDTVNTTEFNETINDNVNNYVPKILDLYKCPDSNIDVNVVHNLSGKHFVSENETDSVMIKLSEMHPHCGDDSLFESKNYLSIDNETKWHYSHRLFAHGWLLMHYGDAVIAKQEQEDIPPHRYCVSSLNDTDFTVKYCRTNCSNEPCISKCCNANKVCNLRETDEWCECEHSGALQWTVSNSLADKPHTFVYYPFICETHEVPFFTLNKLRYSKNFSSYHENELRILDNGSAQIWSIRDGAWLPLTEGKYCVDGAKYFDEFSGETSDMVLYTCRSEVGPVEPEGVKYILYRILIPVSIIFIILTIIVYLLTWKEQSVHGYTVFSYLATLLILYVSILLSTIPTIAHPLRHRNSCRTIAGVIHFSYLSSMCWLTCVSFDVWRTFRKLNCPTYKSRRKRKYVLFFVFSVGYPALKVSICALLDAMYKNYVLPPVVLPAYGTSVCSMSNSDGITYYLYIPISVLLLLNTVFFLATVITMVKYKKGIREVFNGISNNTSTKADQSFGIYARLFIIMGIFWITQIVCWFALPQTAISIKNSELTSVQKINAVVDALTVLQAVVIFYIFACKRSVFVNLWNLQPWLNPFLSLCISGGCCTTPPDTGRRISIPSQSVNSTMKGALKSRKGSGEAANHRMSTESNKTIVLNVRNPVPSITSEDSRKISVTSNETVISHVESGCKVPGVTDDKPSGFSKTVSSEPAAETSL